MQSLNNVWKSRISIPTKLKLYNSCILSIMLGGCMQDWCSCSVVLENAAWNQMAPICSQWWNDIEEDITKQPNLTGINQLRCLSILGHIARMDDDADAKTILTAPPPHNGKRPPGVPVSRGWTPSNEMWELTALHWTKQSIWLRTALSGAYVYIWCYALLVVHARKEEEDAKS